MVNDLRGERRLTNEKDKIKSLLEKAHLLECRETETRYDVTKDSPAMLLPFSPSR